jgi:hypothetical protein
MACLAIVLAPFLSHAQETDRDPTSVLEARGLKRVGNLYLLEAEIAVQSSLQQNRAQLKRLLAQAQTLKQTANQATLTLNQAAQRQARLEFQREDLMAYIERAGADPYGQGGINQARANLRAIENQLFQFTTNRSNLESEQRRRVDQLEELSAEIDSLQQVIAEESRGMNAQYQKIAADPEVFQALRKLNEKARPWVMMGPEDDAPRKLAQLAERVLTESGYKPNPKKKQITTAAELAFNEGSHQAWVLQQKLGASAANNPSTKTQAEFKTHVEKLRPLADETRQSHNALTREPILVAALAEYEKATGTKLKPTIGPEFDKNLKRLAEFEAAAKIARPPQGRSTSGRASGKSTTSKP